MGPGSSAGAGGSKVLASFSLSLMQCDGSQNSRCMAILKLQEIVRNWTLSYLYPLGVATPCVHLQKTTAQLSYKKNTLLITKSRESSCCTQVLSFASGYIRSYPQLLAIYKPQLGHAHPACWLFICSSHACVPPDTAKHKMGKKTTVYFKMADVTL